MLMILGAIAFVYSVMMCFEINPMGIRIWPGLVAIAGALFFLGGDSWMIRKSR